MSLKEFGAGYRSAIAHVLPFRQAGSRHHLISADLFFNHFSPRSACLAHKADG